MTVSRLENEQARLRVALSLTKSHTRMMHLLMRQMEVTRQQMSLTLWNGYPRAPRSLNVMVCNLRARLRKVDPRITILTNAHEGWKLSSQTRAIVMNVIHRHFNEPAKDDTNANVPLNH